MEVVIVTMICAAVSAPLIAVAWAIKPRRCSQCGATVEPDKELVRTLMGG